MKRLNNASLIFYWPSAYAVKEVLMAYDSSCKVIVCLNSIVFPPSKHKRTSFLIWREASHHILLKIQMRYLRSTFYTALWSDLRVLLQYLLSIPRIFRTNSRKTHCFGRHIFPFGIIAGGQRNVTRTIRSRSRNMYYESLVKALTFWLEEKMHGTVRYV